MSKKNLYTLIGFLLFVIGILTLLINLVGLDFGILKWLEVFGRLGAFCIKLGMIFGGVIMVVLANADEEAADEYLQ